MGAARLLHPHRPGHLPAQHAAWQHILDNRARPFTTRHCVASDRLRRPLTRWPLPWISAPARTTQTT